ncbi:3-oxoadipate enol-lactonase [Tropicimonas sp. IMCC34043]|uniref:3-oxoadipate enol-lactonase n=1 Tax=Tropicimonas sp. IMCC34043 TaxID=2248760 RepID=UPI000E22A63F|nr:3-oxoadipate enol-lactonase [Tropicimonas sp. IMCC34043]
MQMADLGDVALHWRQDGDPTGPAVVFANALGTDLRIWDRVIHRLPDRYRLIRYDMRGHGLSDCPAPPYSMGALVHDAERLIEALDVSDCVFVGLSIGGLVAQGLAIKRLDLVRAMVLSNTAAKIGTAQIWQQRIATLRESGIEAIADATMEKWFTAGYRATPEVSLWRNMLTRTPLEGYIGCCHAISGTDFYTPLSGLTLPTLAIAGSDDGSTPADLVRETAALVKGSEFHLIRGAGHMPGIEQPRNYAERLVTFLERIGH